LLEQDLIREADIGDHVEKLLREHQGFDASKHFIVRLSNDSQK
jgi:hypothetical protein